MGGALCMTRKSEKSNGDEVGERREAAVKPRRAVGANGAPKDSRIARYKTRLLGPLLSLALYILHDPAQHPSKVS
jgi:hypothetical protein